MSEDGTSLDMESTMSGGTMDTPFPLDALFSAERAQSKEIATTIGRFSILREIGQGGMGVVYLGHDARLDRRAAIKLLGADGEQGRARLLREAQALARLSHPNVVPIYESGEHGEGAYIAMEYVAGCTLRDWMRRAPRTVAQIVEVFVAAGRGLQAAHEHGLAHRDFKPENVMIGDDGRVRVMDFGLVRAFADADSEPTRVDPGAASPDEIDELREISESAAVDLTATGSLLGTPAYMAPEQYLGAHTGPQTDQFSFCVTLWEALYGARPFSGTTAATLATNILAGRITEPNANAKVPARLRKILERGMAIAPQKRWASMGTLLTLLERELSVSRRRAFAVAAIGIMAALILVAGFAWQRAAQLREVAAENRAAVAQRQALQASQLLAEGNGVDALTLAIEAAAGLADVSGSIPANLPAQVNRSLHDASTAELRWGAIARLPGFASAVSFNADGTQLALALGERISGIDRPFIEIRSVEDDAVSATLTGHQCIIRDMHVFADGTRLLARCIEGEGAYLWDTSGALLASFDGQALATVSPAGGVPVGAVIATRSGHDVQLTDASGELVASSNGHTGAPTVLTFRADGSRLATAGPDAVRIWDATSGEALTVIDHASAVAVTWFADGSGRLATVAMDQHVRIWDAASGELLVDLVPGAGQTYPSVVSEDVHGLVTSPDGSRVALYIDRKLWLWDTATGELIEQLVDHAINPLDNDRPWVFDYAFGDPLTFSPDSSRMVVRRHDGGILLLDSGSGAAIRESDRLALSYAFTPDGESLAVGNKGVDIWDADTGARSRTLEGASLSNIAVFSPDGRYLVIRGTKDDDWTVDVWDSRVVPASLTTLGQSSGPAVVLAVAAAGGRLLMADAALATITDAGSGQQLSTLEGQAGGVLLAAFSRDGQVLATIDRDERLQIWDAGSGTRLAGPVDVHDRVTALAISDDGAHVALASDEVLRIQDARSNAMIVEIDGRELDIEGVAFAPDGRQLAVLGDQLWIHGVPDGELIHEIDAINRGSGVTFSLDGTRVATDRGLWDATTGALINELEYAESSGPVVFPPVVFSPAGTILAAGGQLWDGFTGALSSNLEGHERPVLALGFLEGGDRMVTVSRDAILVRDAVPAIEAACMRLRPYGVAYAEVAAVCDPALRSWETGSARVPALIVEHRVDAHWVVESVLALTLLALMLAVGLSARLERLCSRLPHARVLAGPAYHLSFATVVAVLALVLVGSRQLLPTIGWLTFDWPVLWVVVIPAALRLTLRKSPDHWWMWVSVATITGATACVLLAPELVSTIHEWMPTGSATLAALAQPFAHMHEQATFSGFAAHAAGHRAAHHGWQSLGVFAVLVTLGLFGVHRLASFVVRRHGERLGFRSLDQRAATPLVLLLLVALGLVSAPVFNGLARAQERQADRFALEHGGDEHGCAANAAMQSDSSGVSDVDPSLTDRIWHARQPALAERIDACEGLQ